MIDLILFILLGVVTIAVSVFGGHVSTDNFKHRLIFYIFGGMSVILVLLTGYRTYNAQMAAEKASARLDKTITSLSNSSKAIADMSAETVRIGQLNTQLQEQMLAQSNTIADLSRQSIKTITGGDSFGYIVFKLTSPNIWIPLFLHEGKYPLYRVTARITDLEKWGKLSDKSSMPISDLLTYAQTVCDFGDITEQSAKFADKSISVDNTKEHSFNIFFNAKNGFWHQSLKMISVNGKYVIALRVYRKGIKGKDNIILERVDNDYPRNQKGEVEWEK